MALANFFDKSALAASQILKEYDYSEFKEKLLASPIEIAFDKTATDSVEGVATLDMTFRLLSRLYPKLIITALDTEAEKFAERLTDMALEINPDVEFVTESPSATVSIGSSTIERTCPLFYIGSSDFVIRFSCSEPVGSGDSINPLAAGAAACFGAANIFRVVFGDQLPSAKLDESFNISLIDFKKTETIEQSIITGPDLQSIELPETVLVGVGAIGNGVIWALSKMPFITGNLHIVDHDNIELSNLQRYVLTRQVDEKKSKTKFASDYLGTSSLNILPHNGNWASFLSSRNNWKIDTVLSAVDSAAARIEIQGALPQRILNAWTQASDLGVSRHYDFINDPCLACLYPPPKEEKSKSVLVAEAFNLPQDEYQIREMIFNGAVIDDLWINKIAEAKGVDVALLLPHVNKPIWEFYSTVVCGEVLIGAQNTPQVGTPMAFQSALAGILLTSELLLSNSGIRLELVRTMTKINLLRPLTNYINFKALKSTNGLCLCQDNDFRTVYNNKYSES